MNVKRSTKLALSMTVLGLTAACGNNDNDLTTSADTDTFGRPAAETDVATTPDAVVVERTTVVAVDTNNVDLSGSATGAPSTEPVTGSSASSDAITESTTEPATQSAQGETNAATVQMNENQAMGAAATSEQGQESSASSMSNQYIDYKVLDASGQEIGTVEELWDDPNGTPRFLAVKTSGADGMIVIPTEHVMRSQSREALKLPYSASTFQNAPKLSSEQELDAQAQQRILAYYQQQERQPIDQQPQTQQAQTEQAQSQSQLDQSQQFQSGQAQLEQSQEAVARQGSNTNNFAAAEQQDEATIRLKEEQLKIGKRQVQAGGVLLRKVVRTETVNQPIELRREELVIERVPGTGETVAENAEFAEREIFIPLLREEPVIQKDVVIKEVINVGKTAEEVQREVSAQLREEELQIIRRGEAQEMEAVGAPGTTEKGSATGQSQQSIQQSQRDQINSQQSAGQQSTPIQDSPQE